MSNVLCTELYTSLSRVLNKLNCFVSAFLCLTLKNQPIVPIYAISHMTQAFRSSFSKLFPFENVLHDVTTTWQAGLMKGMAQMLVESEGEARRPQQRERVRHLIIPGALVPACRRRA